MIFRKDDSLVKRTRVEDPEAEVNRFQEAKAKAMDQLKNPYDKALRGWRSQRSYFRRSPDAFG